MFGSMPNITESDAVRVDHGNATNTKDQSAVMNLRLQNDDMGRGVNCSQTDQRQDG